MVLALWRTASRDHYRVVKTSLYHRVVFSSKGSISIVTGRGIFQNKKKPCDYGEYLPLWGKWEDHNNPTIDILGDTSYLKNISLLCLAWLIVLITLMDNLFGDNLLPLPGHSTNSNINPFQLNMLTGNIIFNNFISIPSVNPENNTWELPPDPVLFSMLFI